MGLEVLAALGLAVCPPLVYAEQAYRMYQRRDSSGFAKEVCGVLLFANGARVLWWFSERYETPLLIQAILMIAAQLFLLYLCVRFMPPVVGLNTEDRVQSEPMFDAQGRPNEDPPSVSRPQIRIDPPPEDVSRHDHDGHHAPSHSLSQDGSIVTPVGVRSLLSHPQQALRHAFFYVRTSVSGSSRPFNFWNWSTLSTYVWVYAGYMAVLVGLQVALGWSPVYNAVLGTWAMGVEALLPIPQLIQNQKRRSLSGFQLSVLAGWTGGDAFKTMYYIARDAPLQFTVFGAFQLAVDLAICVQAFVFRAKTAIDDGVLIAAEEGSAPPTFSPRISPRSRDPLLHNHAEPHLAAADELELLALSSEASERDITSPHKRSLEQQESSLHRESQYSLGSDESDKD